MNIAGSDFPFLSTRAPPPIQLAAQPPVPPPTPCHVFTILYAASAYRSVLRQAATRMLLLLLLLL